jgi:hypothetical protein
MEKLWRKTSRHRLVILFSLMAASAYCIPLQRYFTMGRYQHYGMAIGLFGLGYLLQTIWSWKIFSHWARMAYLSTGLFSLTVGLTFYYNPWLDAKMAVQSKTTEHMRAVLMFLYLLLSLYVGAVYARWIREEHASRTTTGADLAGPKSPEIGPEQLEVNANSTTAPLGVSPHADPGSKEPSSNDQPESKEPSSNDQPESKEPSSNDQPESKEPSSNDQPGSGESASNDKLASGESASNDKLGAVASGAETEKGSQ